MKTQNRLTGISKILALGLLFFTGTVIGNAQYRGNRHKNEQRKEYKQYRKNDRHNDRYYHRGYSHSPGHYKERVYIRKAPWGVHRPVVLNHSRGRVYYHRGHYYEYHPGHGYCMVETPVGCHIDAVPSGFTRIWVDNTWCYHRDNLYLRPTAHGYISFHRPGISIGASF